MLHLAGHDVRAVSVGGLETCIELPGWRLAFDIGRCPPTAVRWPTVLFSHAHTDHMGGVIHHCATRDLQSMGPPTYVMPAENVHAFGDMMAAWRRLDRSDLPCDVVPARPGDVMALRGARFARIFRAIHRVPSVGYALCRRTKKLRDDLVGRPQEEIRAAALAGVDVAPEREVVEVVFCGDTTVDVVDREPLVRAARLLILEVTFFDHRVSVEKARAKGHVHLDEVVTRADLLQNEAVLLTHRSRRYGDDEAERLLDQRLPKDLRERVTLLRTAPPWV